MKHCQHTGILRHHIWVLSQPHSQEVRQHRNPQLSADVRFTSGAVGIFINGRARRHRTFTLQQAANRAPHRMLHYIQIIPGVRRRVRQLTIPIRLTTVRSTSSTHHLRHLGGLHILPQRARRRVNLRHRHNIFRQRVRRQRVARLSRLTLYIGTTPLPIIVNSTRIGVTPARGRQTDRLTHLIRRELQKVRVTARHQHTLTRGTNLLMNSKLTNVTRVVSIVSTGTNSRHSINVRCISHIRASTRTSFRRRNVRINLLGRPRHHRHTRFGMNRNHYTAAKFSYHGHFTRHNIDNFSTISLRPLIMARRIQEAMSARVRTLHARRYDSRYTHKALTINTHSHGRP